MSIIKLKNGENLYRIKVTNQNEINKWVKKPLEGYLKKMHQLLDEHLRKDSSSIVLTYATPDIKYDFCNFQPAFRSSIPWRGEHRFFIDGLIANMRYVITIEVSREQYMANFLKDDAPEEQLKKYFIGRHLLHISEKTHRCWE